jgi:hypothetical protein
MQIISGRIGELRYSSAGEVNGFVLDRGREVHFSPDRASRVLRIVTAGSRVEVRGHRLGSVAGDTHIQGSAITNSDSKRPANLDTPAALPTPEVRPAASLPPRDTAPLALLQTTAGELHAGHAPPQRWGTHNKDVEDRIERAYDCIHRTLNPMATYRSLPELG